MAFFLDRGSVAHSPRLLVLDHDTMLIEILSQTLECNIPRLSIDTCASPEEAQRMLDEGAYQAVVCSPTLTVAGGGSVLTRSRWIEPSVPFLLTLRSDEREFAQQWLDLGVYDFIFSPVDPAQALESVRHALLLSKQRTLISRREESLARLRRRRERYEAETPGSPLRRQVTELLESSIIRIEESVGSLDKTASRIEASLKRLQQNCYHNELHARQRALRRLMA